MPYPCQCDTHFRISLSDVLRILPIPQICYLLQFFNNIFLKLKNAQRSLTPFSPSSLTFSPAVSTIEISSGYALLSLMVQRKS
ncbi:hypothetical protein FKM82_031267 [Ascaphus truei]